MKITELSQSKHVADRWLLRLEDDTLLKVSLTAVADYSLFVGRDLEDEELESLRADARRYAVKSRALQSLNARPMSKKELSDRLLTKGEPAEAVAETVDRLEEVGLLDDAAYAGMIVRHYGAEYGPGRVREELYKRGIPRALWEAALSELPDTDAVCQRLLENRLRGKAPDSAALKKATDYLLRRGFTYDTVRRAVSQYSVDTEDLEEWQ